MGTGRDTPGAGGPAQRGWAINRPIYHPPAGEAPDACRCLYGRMVVIFGFGPGKQEDLGEVAPAVCPNCRNQVFLHHVRSKKSVRLYFVPVVPYGTDDYLVCPVCSRGLQLSAPQLPHLRPMADAVRSYRTGRLGEAQLMAQADRFWRQLGVNPAGQQVLAPPPPGAVLPAPPRAPVPPGPPAQPAPAARVPAAAGGPEPPWMSQLRKLAQLHDQGVLSDADYESAKRRLIQQE